MAGQKVAIVGAGRLAALLATRIPAQVRKVIISRHRARAALLADEVGGIATDQYASVRGCTVAFLAVPGSALEGVMRGLAGHLDPGALVVNMSIEQDTDRLRSLFPTVRLSAAKLLADAGDMLRGDLGVMLVDASDAEAEAHLRDLLEGLGVIVVEHESKALVIAGAVVLELQAAVESLRSRLREQGVSGSLADAVVAALGPTVLRTLAGGNASPWLAAVTAAQHGLTPGPAGEPLLRT